MHKQLLLLFFILLITSACAPKKAEPAKITGFLGHQEGMKSMRSRAPFHQVWRASGPINRNKFRYIFLSPVNTDYLMKSEQMKYRLKSDKDLEKDVKVVAQYMFKTVEKELREYNDPLMRYTTSLVSGNRSQTLLLELAITELLPTASERTLPVSTVGMLVPDANDGKVGSKGSIAFEGRVLDADTNEILAKFADREVDPSGPVLVGHFSAYSGAKTNIDNWATQIAQLANTPPSHKVKESSAFSLKPW